MNEEKARRGRNLSVLSFAIIIYVLAGGYISKDGTFSILGGTFHFNNAYVLKIAALGVFAFYWRRFWIHQRNPCQAIKQAFYNNLHSYTPFQNYIRETSQTYLAQKIANGEPIEGTVWRRGNQDLPHHGILTKSNNTDRSVQIDKMFRPMVYINLQTENSYNASPRIVLMPLNWLTYKRYSFIALNRLITSNGFFDNHLPHVLAFLALIAITWRFTDRYLLPFTYEHLYWFLCML